ncbi:hypothetical protein AB0D71_37165 [Streptomyces avermitilis]|uniref:hypothetical protein n=1 Tax=Streptomyces avermitilis TaxID=33903 RepID=UPI0033CF9654
MNTRRCDTYVRIRETKERGGPDGVSRPPVAASARWTWGRFSPPDVGGSDLAGQGRAPGRAVAVREDARTQGSTRARV